MFDSTSRYAKLETAAIAVTNADGSARVVRYVRRRFVPAPEGMVTLAEHIVVQNDRLDRITARFLGDPLQFWRICDANNVLNSAELTETVGRTVRVALPQG